MKIDKPQLASFWKIDEAIRSKVKINEDVGSFNINKPVRVCIGDKSLVPGWGSDKFDLYVGAVSRKACSEDCKISFEVGEENVSLLDVGSSVCMNNFSGIIDDLLFERYREAKRPLFTRLPFAYYRVPVFLRNFLFAKLAKQKKDPGYPSYPFDYGVDMLRHVFLHSLKQKVGTVPYVHFWPGENEFAMTFSHDLDTASSFKCLESIREVEKEYGVNSSWYVVSRRYKIDFKKLKWLEKDGCEIGVHGYNHDGKLPYLKTGKIEKRLNYSLNKLRSFNVSGFRSAQLQRNERFLRILSKHFDYDSTMPDVDYRSPVDVRSGVCTVFPYFVNRMVELPLSLPQDFRLKYTFNYSKKEYLDAWKNKLEYIRQVGGLAVLNTHPDDYLTGSPEGLDLYEQFLKHVSKMNNKWLARQDEVARWWRSRDSARLKDGKLSGLPEGRVVTI